MDTIPPSVSVFSHSLHFFNLRRARFVRGIVKYLFLIVLLIWVLWTLVTPITLENLYPTDLNINSIFLNILTIYLVLIASLVFSFEKHIIITSFPDMSKKLAEVIPQILFEFGMTSEGDMGPFIDRSKADYKELLEHRNEFSKWHRNIYICELTIIFFICVLSFIDLTLFEILSTKNFWCAHRFSIFFGFISLLTFVIFLHAVVDLLQYKLFNCINLDTGDKNIIDKFNLFKQHKNNISSNMNRILKKE